MATCACTSDYLFCTHTSTWWLSAITTSSRPSFYTCDLYDLFCLFTSPGEPFFTWEIIYDPVIVPLVTYSVHICPLLFIWNLRRLILYTYLLMFSHFLIHYVIFTLVTFMAYFVYLYVLPIFLGILRPTLIIFWYFVATSARTSGDLLFFSLSTTSFGHYLYTILFTYLPCLSFFYTESVHNSS